MDLKMSEEETMTGDQYFTKAVSLQGEGKGDDALKVLDQAEAAWKAQGKLDGETPYAKALNEMREKLQSASQKEEDPAQIALLKSVKEAAAAADEAVKKKEVKAARASYDKATKLYESDAELDDKDTSIMLRELGQRVKFAEWKEQAEANTERSEEEWAEREAMKRARKERVKAEVQTLQKGDDAMLLRTSAKEQADSAYSLAEQLLDQGDFAGARDQLEVAEQGWAAAGMLGFPGKPFEAAIESVREKIAEKEAAA